jgi:hypothetical protein
MKPLNFHPDAAEEAREVAAHYGGIRTELGTEFQAELDAALARIQDNPLMYAAEAGNIRVCSSTESPRKGQWNRTIRFFHVARNAF